MGYNWDIVGNHCEFLIATSIGQRNNGGILLGISGVPLKDVVQPNLVQTSELSLTTYLTWFLTLFWHLF